MSCSKCQYAGRAPGRPVAHSRQVSMNSLCTYGRALGLRELTSQPGGWKLGTAVHEVHVQVIHAKVRQRLFARTGQRPFRMLVVPQFDVIQSCSGKSSRTCRYGLHCRTQRHSRNVCSESSSTHSLGYRLADTRSEPKVPALWRASTRRYAAFASELTPDQQAWN